MSDIREKLVTVESLGSLHTYGKNTYATKDALTTANNEIGVLNSRMDTIIIEAVGDSNQEVADARIGYDGTTYVTAGTAIRTQFSHVADGIKSLSKEMSVGTDNLIDTRAADNWNQGSISDTSNVLTVVHNPLEVSGKTIYFGGISSGNLSAISVYSFSESGTQLAGKTVTLSGSEWKYNSLFVSSAASYVIAEVRIASGYGGITPEKLAGLAPKLFVSEALYTEDSFEYSTKLANIEALQNRMNANAENIHQTTLRVEDLETNTGLLKTWKQMLVSTPQFMHVETTEAKCMCTYDKYLYICGGQRFEQWDVSCEFAPKLVAKAYPLSGLNMRAYQMAISSDGAYIYMAARLTSAGYTGEEFAGGLFIMDTGTLSVVQTIQYSNKASGLEMNSDKTLLAVNLQVGGWILYDISTDKANPAVLFEHHEEQGQLTNEYHRGEFVTTPDHKLLYIVAGFTDGIRIWDCTDTSNVQLLKLVSVTNDMGLNGAHVFDLTIQYPYVYCTIAPWTSLVNTDGAYYGLMLLNISDIGAVTTRFIPIDNGDINTYGASDPKPCEIVRFGDKLLLNNGNMGVAVYSIEDVSAPVYRGCIPCGGEEAHSLHGTDDGRLFVGNAFVQPFGVRIFRGI